MKLAIFAKKRTSQDGRKFVSYLTTLTDRETGESITASVKFREDCGSPDAGSCPSIIEVPKGQCNINAKRYTNSQGEEGIGYTLWISEWKYLGAYEDHSMDRFAGLDE